MWHPSSGVIHLVHEPVAEVLKRRDEASPVEDPVGEERNAMACKVTASGWSPTGVRLMSRCGGRRRATRCRRADPALQDLRDCRREPGCRHPQSGEVGGESKVRRVLFPSEGLSHLISRGNVVHQPLKILWIGEVFSGGEIPVADVAAEIGRDLAAGEQAVQPEQDRIIARVQESARLSWACLVVVASPS